MSITTRKVTDYARSKVGRRVFADVKGAKGECWDLVFMALKDAGAKTPHDLSSVYRWSTRTVSMQQAAPGDIIQYNRLKITVRKDFEDGAWETKTFEIGDPRHTAIIKAIKANGVIEVFEQNVGGVRETAVNEYYLKPGNYRDGETRITVTKTRGRFTIYRPVPKN